MKTLAASTITVQTLWGEKSQFRNLAAGDELLKNPHSEVFLHFPQCVEEEKYIYTAASSCEPE